MSLIGELFKLQMLTEKIMHGCMKKEADLERLCTLLKIIGQSLDKAKANFHFHFERMGEIPKKENIAFGMKSMLLVCQIRGVRSVHNMLIFFCRRLSRSDNVTGSLEARLN